AGVSVVRDQVLDEASCRRGSNAHQSWGLLAIIRRSACPWGLPGAACAAGRSSFYLLRGRLRRSVRIVFDTGAAQACRAASTPSAQNPDHPVLIVGEKVVQRNQRLPTTVVDAAPAHAR